MIGRRDAAVLESRRRSIALEVATLAALPPPLAFGWSVGLVGPDGMAALRQMTQRDAGKRRRPITPTPPQPQPGSRKSKPPRQCSEPGAVGPTPSTSEAFRSISELKRGRDSPMSRVHSMRTLAAAETLSCCFTETGCSPIPFPLSPNLADACLGLLSTPELFGMACAELPPPLGLPPPVLPH